MMGTHETAESFDLRPHLAIVARYKYLILTFCISAALTSLAMTYVMSEKFEAYTTFLYQPNDAVSFRPKEREALGFPTPLVSLESIGNTLDELVKNDAALEKVVRALRLDVKRPRPQSNWFVSTFHAVKDAAKEYGGNAWQLLRYGRLIEKDPFAEAIANLRKNVSTERTAKAYTFQLAAVDADPEMAAKIVDLLAATLAESLQHVRLQVARESRDGLVARLRNNEAEIDALRTKLDTFKRDARLSSLSEELSLKLKTVAEFQEESSRARNELRALQMKRAEQQRQLDAQEQLVKYDSTSTQNPVVEEMRLELAKLEVERSGLLKIFTEEHQQVQAVDAKLAQVRRKLASESDNVVSSESTRASEIYQKLLADRLATDAEIESVTARQAAYNRSIGQETAGAQSLTSKEQELTDLSVQLVASERSYALINEALEEARIAESRVASEVAILYPATVPRAPVRPNKILHVSVSAIFSLVLGVGMAFVFSFFDTSIRRIDQVERIFQVPVLATIPAVRADRHGNTVLRVRVRVRRRRLTRAP
jgi:uncharacterized protein involved in exopolysaccharide biosynthesis